jgi:hypothetical protein
MTRCMDPGHRSYSGDRGFDECQWRDAQYRAGVRKVVSPRMAVGSAVDEAICAITRSDVAPNVPAIVARIAAAEGIAAARIDEMSEKAIGLVDLWVREVYPTCPTIYAEQHELHWEHEEIVFHAHLDLVWADSSVDDVKTSEKRLAERRADEDEQLTYYGWGMRSVYGIVPVRVGLVGLIWANPPADVKTWRPDARKPWLDRQQATRTAEQIDALAARAVRRERVRRWADETGNHLANGRSVAFACNDCAVKSECPAWTGFDTREIVDVAA